MSALFTASSLLKILCFDAPQCVAQRGGRRVAALGPLRQKRVDHSLQRDRATGRQSGDRRRATLEYVDQRLERRGGGERQPFGRHVEQHDAERKQIASRVERLLANALGRHVVRGAERPAGNGRSVERRGGDVGETKTACQSEVEHLHVP
jgi:hypothetical protein